MHTNYRKSSFVRCLLVAALLLVFRQIEQLQNYTIQTILPIALPRRKFNQCAPTIIPLHNKMRSSGHAEKSEHLKIANLTCN